MRARASWRWRRTTRRWMPTLLIACVMRFSRRSSTRSEMSSHMALHADFLELETTELVEYLLRESGQANEGPTNPTALLDFLKLQFVVLDLVALLPSQKKQP